MCMSVVMLSVGMVDGVISVGMPAVDESNCPSDVSDVPSDVMSYVDVVVGISDVICVSVCLVVATSSFSNVSVVVVDC